MSNPYSKTDKVINAINRRIVIEFGIMRSRLVFDELTIMKLIKNLYEQLYVEVKQFYIALIKSEYYNQTDSVLEELKLENLLKGVLQGYNPVTLYVFENEFSRKAERLIEALLGDWANKDTIIDKHMKYLARQIAQGAITARDDSVKQAYEDLGITQVIWQTAEDEKVCSHCNELDGRVYDISKVPDKPHFNCRCIILPYEE